jgi:hypothetical protein
VATTASHRFRGPGGGERRTRGTHVPQRSTLAGFAEAVSRTQGIDVQSVEPLTLLVVRTENSVYQIVLLGPGESRIAVQGGQFFGSLTEGRLAGSSFGGSLLKLAWVGVGLHLEIYARGQRIVTSRVRAIEIRRSASPGTVH